jgi:hypothetical protein
MTNHWIQKGARLSIIFTLYVINLRTWYSTHCPRLVSFLYGCPSPTILPHARHDLVIDLDMSFVSLA